MDHIHVEQSVSSTAYVPMYVRYQFQTTRSGDLVFSEGIWMQDSFPEEKQGPSMPEMHLAVIDGELYLLDEGAPPGLEPLPEDAGILHAVGD